MVADSRGKARQGDITLPRTMAKNGRLNCMIIIKGLQRFLKVLNGGMTVLLPLLVSLACHGPFGHRWVFHLAQGILEYKRKRQRMQIDTNIQNFLDRFYMSRIGIRMLIGQHIALTDQKQSMEPNYVGIICTKTNVRELAQEAIDNARFVCEDHYALFDAPKIQLVCKPDLHFMYVPGHLSHMLFETLKNSLRAVVETHGQDKDEFPVTKVIIAEGKEDITIKISDEGGGIPRSAIPLVWTYMYTTVERTPNLDPDFNKSDFKAPMAGFGYGLPISRLYARYFGGDLKLISMEG